jgi:DnaK suppressor protein
MIFNLKRNVKTLTSKKRRNMTKAERLTIKAQINLDLIKLKAQIIKLKEGMIPIAPDCSLGRLTRVEVMNEQVLTMKILEEAKLRETRLKNALSRVEHELFGICIECEESIGVARMLIRPESVRCVGCAF